MDRGVLLTILGSRGVDWDDVSFRKDGTVVLVWRGIRYMFVVPDSSDGLRFRDYVRRIADRIRAHQVGVKALEIRPGEVGGVVYIDA